MCVCTIHSINTSEHITHDVSANLAVKTRTHRILGIRSCKPRKQQHLKNIRYHLVGYLSAVLIPVLAVFLMAFGVVSKGAVDKKDSKPKRISVGHDAKEESWNWPQESQYQLRHIVEMASQAPVARNQQKTCMCLSTGQFILCVNHLSRPTPDQTLSVGLANFQFLAICGVVDHAAGNTSRKDEQWPEETQLDCSWSKVHAHGGIDSRDPAEAAPADVEPSPVEHYVNGSHVPGFPPEELGEVDHLQYCRYPDAVDEAVQLVVLQI